jgi:hypothetical protein
MTMTTLAGTFGNTAHRAGQSDDVTPSNRATHALLATDPAPVVELDTQPEDVRLAAAYDLAACIRTNLPLLTLRERLVLAAALLPEFDLPDDA